MRIKKSEFYSYDSNRNILLCRGRIGLMNTLKILLPREINLKKTLKQLRMAGYIDLQGKPHTFRNYPALFSYLEHDLNLPIRANKCFLTGMAMVSPLFTLVLKSVPEQIIEPDPEPEIEPTLEEVVNDLVVDIEYAKAFENADDIQGSKRALAEYASKFGINLKQNKKFENMIHDLEKEL